VNPKAGKFAKAELPVWEGDDAPPTEHHWKELLWNAGRLLGTFRKRGPRGPDDGQPVLVVPGFLCSDQTTFSLRKRLARHGYRVHGWKQGWNLGTRADTIDRLRERVEGLGHDRKIVLVGWSLGGLFAREYARYHPDQVRAVITLGSPFSGDPRQNTIWPLYERIAGHSVLDPPLPRITDKPPVPHLALWSRRDGLIAPRAARGLDHERDEEVELDCHHMAFAISPDASKQVVREIDRFLKNHE
jgi:pimeloyl-ACP methyl ester carboxylesterase